MSTLGVVGAGQVGASVARAAVARGHRVVISNSRGVDSLRGVVAALGSGARAGSVGDAAAADLVLVAIPVAGHADLPASAFAGRLVLDATNYYPERDGDIPELLSGATTSSERLQRLLPAARVVKALNILNAAEIESTSRPSGEQVRRALPIASDDRSATAVVAQFLDELGFDVVDVGGLAESWRFGPGTPAYIVQSTARELRDRIAAAERPGTTG